MAWCLNRFLDGMDGVVARATKTSSDFGGYLDIVVDFTVYGVVPLGIVLGHPTAQRFVLVVVLEVT